MSPRFKAKHIISKMMLVQDENNNPSMSFKMAKECAIISVGETVATLEHLINPDISVKFQIMWWNSVRDELDKM